ncbi:hypothetical protein AGMMS50276_21520 [Synergistales bacterium]|nr:hypothetical protein AGMMS50276_21520 [Synergistales bacterium]
MGEEAIQYDHNVTFEKVWAALDRISVDAERSRQDAERRAQEFERGMQELKLSMQETARQIDKLGGRDSDLIKELLVSDTFFAKFKAMGYIFSKIGERVTIKDEHDKTLVEIDFMLENEEYVLAGEVKLQPDVCGVTEHVERMKKIRAYSDERGDTRKLIGAIAGAIFDDRVKERAQAAGFFVITASGENVDIEPSPEGWKPKTEWV